MRIAGQTIDDLKRADAAQRGAPGGASDKAKAGSPTADSVQLSSASARASASLSTDEAARSERIEALRQQVARGEYTVDTARLADSMLREESARGFALGGPP